MTKKLVKEIIVSIENQGTDDAFFNVVTDASEIATPNVKIEAAVYVLKERITVESITKVSHRK